MDTGPLQRGREGGGEEGREGGKERRISMENQLEREASSPTPPERKTEAETEGSAKYDTTRSLASGSGWL